MKESKEFQNFWNLFVATKVSSFVENCIKKNNYKERACFHKEENEPG